VVGGEEDWGGEGEGSGGGAEHGGGPLPYPGGSPGKAARAGEYRPIISCALRWPPQPPFRSRRPGGAADLGSAHHLARPGAHIEGHEEATTDFGPAGPRCDRAWSSPVAAARPQGPYLPHGR